jgi:hypothetical protein
VPATFRLQKLAVGQQHPKLLNYGVSSHARPIKPDSHHLGDTAGIVAIGLVDLCLQYRPHVPCLDTDHRQAGFGKSIEQPCDNGSASSPIRLKRYVGFFRTASKASGSLATFTSRVIFSVSSTMQMLVSLTGLPHLCAKSRHQPYQCGRAS